MKTRLPLAAIVTAIAAVVTAPSYAQDFPSRPITIVVPYAPGGSADQNARMLGATMSKTLGQPVIVQNKVGASGNVGNAFVANATPDGYTVLLGNTTIVMNPFLYDTLSYDPSALVPVVMVNQFPLVMVTNNAVPASTVSDFVEYARPQPGKLNFASAALGSSTHLAGELFNTKTGVQLLHVPYGGSMPALTALASGDVHVFFDTALTALPLIQAGKVKALAVASDKRLATLPEVPTVIESGYPEFGTVTAWQGVFAPPGTPADIVQKLREAVNAAMVDPENQKTLEAKGGIFLKPDATGEASARFLADERQKWGPLIKSLDIKLDK